MSYVHTVIVWTAVERGKRGGEGEEGGGEERKSFQKLFFSLEKSLERGAPLDVKKTACKGKR